MGQTKAYQIETSITLDYRKSAWGLERIVLDGVANHLPDDSKGTRVSVKLRQDGQQVPLKEADPQKKTDEVVFEDDGSGYDAGMLSILFSSKTANELSVGHFGEGLKLVATAALRNGIDIEYHSKNWIARPFAKPERIGGHEIQKLCFEVQENGFDLQGSRTVIRNPSDDLMKEIYNIPNKILALNDSHEVLSIKSESYLNAYPSKIIKLPDGATTLFIKGVKISDSDSIFSYDLGLNSITPDRIFADMDRVLNSIRDLLDNCASQEVIETVLRIAVEKPNENYMEFEALDREGAGMFFSGGLCNSRQKGTGLLSGSSPVFSLPFLFFEPSRSVSFPNPHSSPAHERVVYGGNAGHGVRKFDIPDSLKKRLFPENNFLINHWASAFKQMFGENAVLASGDVNENKDAKLMGYKPILLNHRVKDYLVQKGIKSVSDFANETEYKWIDMSELTEAEKNMIGRVPEINQIILEKQASVGVRVYQGLYTKTGREIESATGVRGIDPLSITPFIGIKRNQLGSLEDFTETYIHELGHEVTGAGDYDREFTDFFVKALSKLAIQYMKNE